MKSTTTTTATTAILAALAASATAQTTAATTVTSSSPSSTASCASGIHLIVARGSGEDPGLGRVGVVATNITAKIEGSTIEAVDYPATIDDPVYFDSVDEGTVAIEELLTGYVAKCPGGKVGLIGYSQGAQIASDMVCGTSEALFGVTADLSSQYETNIVAVVLFGNPAHLGNSSWNAGTSTEDGIFPRKDVQGCEPYIPKMRSWCDTGDIYCDSGNDRDVHGSYFEKYTEESSDWVVSMYSAALSSSSSSSSSSATDTATGSAAIETGSTGTNSESGASEASDSDAADESSGFRILPTWPACLALGVGAFLLL